MLTHVAEAGVMMATLLVVVVGDYGCVDVEQFEKVEAFVPVGLTSDLIHLVDGKRGCAQRQCRCRRECHRGSELDSLLEQFPKLDSTPVVECVGRTPGPGEDIVRSVDAIEEALSLVTRSKLSAA